jgi:phospho-N-acetylmuramoyl-pentapeptide-transferase
MNFTQGQLVLFFCLIGSAAVTFALAWLFSRTPSEGTVIREQGPAAHRKKAATPSTGGRAFLVSFVLVGFPAAVLLTDPRAIIGVTAGLLTGLIGLADDILKAAKRKSSGLKARYKLPIQIVVGLLITSAVYYQMGDDTLRIPFTKTVLEVGSWKILIGLLCYLTLINAVNFTDGLDGLAASTVFVAALFLGLAFWTTKTSSAVVPVLLMGVCAGFLPVNWNPARIFMGDSGSLCLGGALAAAAIASGLEITVFIIGLVFILEITTVVLQVVFFRLTGGKRLFKMTPIHHAFELRGYSEPVIVFGFSIFGFAAGILGWLLS